MVDVDNSDDRQKLGIRVTFVTGCARAVTRSGSRRDTSIWALPHYLSTYRPIA